MIANAVDGLEVDASTLKSTLDTDVTSLVSDLKALVPELPALPDVNLQGQLTSLAGLAAGSGLYNTLLAGVSSKFGSGLTAGGFSLDSLVSDAAAAITGGTDLCSAVPNFNVPAAGGDAVQKAIEVLQPEVDSLSEEPSVQLANANFTAEKAAVEETFASYEEIGEEVPAEDIGPYRVAEETTKVAVSDNQGSVTTIEATTPKNSVGASTTVTKETVKSSKSQTTITSGGEVTERSRSNVAKEGKGFTRRTISITQDITEDDFDFSDKFPYNYEIRLKHIPLKIRRARGWNDSLKKKFKWVNIYPPTNPIIQAQASRGKILTDTWELKGKTLIVTDLRGAGYGPHPKSELYFRVTYSYLDNYDPNYAGPADEE